MKSAAAIAAMLIVLGLAIAAGANPYLARPGETRVKERLSRVLTNDPGTGVMRHVDAGYEEAIEFARESGVKIPML